MKTDLDLLMIINIATQLTKKKIRYGNYSQYEIQSDKNKKSVT